jgi:hypothetical protein
MHFKVESLTLDRVLRLRMEVELGCVHPLLGSQHFGTVVGLEVVVDVAISCVIAGDISTWASIDIDLNGTFMLFPTDFGRVRLSSQVFIMLEKVVLFRVHHRPVPSEINWALVRSSAEVVSSRPVGSALRVVNRD